MTFREWKSLSPEAAAREVHRRAASLLSPAQRRAAIESLIPLEQLAANFDAARGAGPLAGVPFLAKDLFDFAGTPTFAGSTFLPEVRPAGKSDGAFARALRTAGAVFAGKTRMHEFAYGITGENPHHGDCEVPGHPGRTTGGSSSGSAATVAAGIIPFALASDTGGSVRVPAAFCGLHGFRMTPGHPWIADAFALAPTFDTAGWFTRGADDMRTSLEALMPAESAPARSARGVYLPLPGVDAEVAEACATEAAKICGTAPVELSRELLAGFEPALTAYHTIVALEAWEVHRGWAEANQARYDPLVWQRLQRHREINAEQAAAARKTVQGVREVWAAYFRQHDFLIMPATPAAAPTKAGCTLEMRNRLIRITAPASLGGLPVLSVPVRLPSGLTTGLQIVAPRSDSFVFRQLLSQ
jgi:amidase/aspartyl-tRNA(Asn)/glutamyl-tRNA(Gln) amidotransferase subunit A